MTTEAPTTEAPAQSTAPAATPATPKPFIGGDNPQGQSAPAATDAPRSFFSDQFQKDGQFVEGWTEALRQAGFETTAGKLQTAKDEKGALSMIDHAIKTASRRELKGAPDESWKEPEIAEYRRAHGVPEKIEEYNLKPEKLPEGVQWSDEKAAKYAEIFHKNHVPAKAAQELMAAHLEEVTAQAGEAQGAINARIEKLATEAETTFKKEWGDEYDTRLEANVAFATTRFTADELKDPLIQTALSHPGIVRLLDEARRGLRNGPPPAQGREQTPGSMSPAQQARELMAKHADWQRNPDVHHRINDLLAQQAALDKRKR